MTDAQTSNALLASDPYLYQLHWSIVGMFLMGITQQ